MKVAHSRQKANQTKKKSHTKKEKEKRKKSKLDSKQLFTFLVSIFNASLLFANSANLALQLLRFLK